MPERIPKVAQNSEVKTVPSVFVGSTPTLKKLSCSNTSLQTAIDEGGKLCSKVGALYAKSEVSKLEPPVSIFEVDTLVETHVNCLELKLKCRYTNYK